MQTKLSCLMMKIPKSRALRAFALTALTCRDNEGNIYYCSHQWSEKGVIRGYLGSSPCQGLVN